MRSRWWPLLMFLVLLPALARAASPAGWILAGSNPTAYEMERDVSVTRGGLPSGRLASVKSSSGFGTMMQSISVEEYGGKRIRFSAYVKTRDVKGWAGLWMRVDSDAKMPLAFDNMQDRPIKGSQDWTRYNVVLDVPDGAIGIAFGVLLAGDGAVWINDVRFEPVDASVPVTGKNTNASKKPQNLNFER